MGSIGNSGRLAAFQSDVFASGLDLGRSEITRDLGVYRAADSATILQGQMVSLDANQELVLADATEVFGVAKWNKAQLGTSVIVDEASVVAYGATVSLARGNVSNVVVRTTPNGSTVIPATNNYTLSTANGTLAWGNPPTGTNAPADGATVYVTYTFALTTQDYRFQGLNFFNTLDDVTISEGRLTVIQGPATLFTTQYDTAQTYAVNNDLYVGGTTAGLEGLFTNQSSEGTYVGKVIQPPTAEDPYLGLQFFGSVEETP